MIGPDLLNDLFSNNVDFVAKQMQTIIDALFPSNEDNSETDYTTQPILFTGQIKVYQGVSTGGWKTGFTLYNVQFNPYSDSNALTPIGFAEDATQTFIDNFSPYLDEPYLYGNSSYTGLTTYNSNGFVQIRSGGNNVPFQWATYYGGIQQQNKRVQATNENHDTNGSLYFPYSYGTLDFGQLSDSKVFVITTDRDSAQTIYNHIDFNNDYHTFNTYNYGDTNIYAGGGAGGLVVAPVGMFNYGELKLALDSLIDELNLNFSNSDNILPISEFPSYNDVKYEDMGSFYITPIKQIDTLPLAPDIADTVIDVSEPLGILSTGFGALLDSFNNIGVTLTLTFTFLSCLIINKLRGD